MENKLINSIRNGALIVGITLGSLLPFQKASADDIYKGMRGPTNWQLDSRVSYSENEQKVKTTTGNLILKYWNGDEFGWWGFLNLPYKSIDISDKSSNGFGDISSGIGLRGRVNNFHWFSYAGLTFPTGDDESKPALGNGRLDTKIGLLGTYLTSDKKHELDGILERNITGKDNSGVNPLDETYIGLLGGGKVTEKLRFVTGPTSLIKDNGDYIANWRAILRYTISSQLHFELIGDNGIDGHNIPESTGIGLYVRRNF